MVRKTENAKDPAPDADKPVEESSENKGDKAREVGGRDGPDPTRFGDWEKNGRCIDF